MGKGDAAIAEGKIEVEAREERRERCTEQKKKITTGRATREGTWGEGNRVEEGEGSQLRDEAVETNRERRKGGRNRGD